MPLLSLPTEVLAGIVAATLPEGIEAFAITCKQIHRISKPSIAKYSELRRQFSTWPPSGTETWSEGDSRPRNNNKRPHPISLLYEIQQNPLVARYLKHGEFMQYADVDPPTQDLFEKCNGGRQFLESSSIIPRTLVSSKPRLRNQEGVPLEHHSIDKWHKDILSGEPGPVITLLLTLLPNLKTLFLMDTWQYHLEYLDSIMMTIASDIIDFITRQPTSNAPLSSSSLVLSSLQHLHVHHSDDETGTPFQVLAPFLALPSLRSVYGYQVEGDSPSYSSYNWPFEGRASAVQSIKLEHSAISGEGLRQFLQPLSHLASFTYGHSCKGGGAGYLWNGGGFLRAIVDTIGDHLEELSLYSSISISTRVSTSLTAMDTFRLFKSLRKLTLQADFLFGEKDEGKGDTACFEKYNYDSVWYKDKHQYTSTEVVPLWSNLPTSLEELILHLPRDLDHELEDDKRFAGVFDNIASVKSRLLPNLEKVTRIYPYREPNGPRYAVTKEDIMFEAGVWEPKEAAAKIGVV